MKIEIFLFFSLLTTKVVLSEVEKLDISRNLTTALPISSLGSTLGNQRRALHAHPYGPHFEEENETNVTVREGNSSLLNCRVEFIGDKLVSWFRRSSEKLDLLTLGKDNHNGDPRITSDFKYPNNWRLSIANSTKNDSGVYICQISTHPPKILQVNLTIEAPEVFIENSLGKRVNEVYYQEGSTLFLICSVYKVGSKEISWYHNLILLNQDVLRGGVSIRTEINLYKGVSTLKIARVGHHDSGNYSCSAPPQKKVIVVQVLSAGEAPAELYLNRGRNVFRLNGILFLHLFVIYEII